jgi:hypothetical protein
MGIFIAGLMQMASDNKKYSINYNKPIRGLERVDVSKHTVKHLMEGK